MRSRIVFVAIVTLLLVGAMQSVVSATTLTPANASFEAPAVPDGTPNGLIWTPSLADQGGAGWTYEVVNGGCVGVTKFYGAFSPICGIAGTMPDGSQAGCWQVAQGWQMSMQQDISGFLAGPATVSFAAGASAAWGDGATPIQVFIDGTALNFGGVDTLTPSRGGWANYTSDPITLTAGTHTLKFANVVETANLGLSAAIDTVSVNTTAAPEPSTVVLLLTGLVGLSAYAWRKRK